MVFKVFTLILAMTLLGFASTDFTGRFLRMYGGIIENMDVLKDSDWDTMDVKVLWGDQQELRFIFSLKKVPKSMIIL